MLETNVREWLQNGVRPEWQETARCDKPIIVYYGSEEYLGVNRILTEDVEEYCN